jgi:hypothetical protein
MSDTREDPNGRSVSPREDRVLVVAALASPVAWVTTYILGYFMAEFHAPRWSLLTMSALALAGIAAGGAAGWSARGGDLERRAFLADVAVGLAGFFFLVVLAQATFQAFAPWEPY